MKTIDSKRPSKIRELTYILKVEDVMQRDIITLRPDNTMNDLRKILRDKKISGLPVMDNDRLAGIVTIEDLVICILEGGDITVFSDEPVV